MHAPRRRLSACLIVRDEADNLGACLESIRDVADEIIVVDTGSQDATVRVARDFGAVLGSYAWNDDFAAARNASLDLADGDWILAIDADQRLDAGSAEELRRIVDCGEPAMYLLRQINYADSGSSAVENRTGRLFPNHPRVRYCGRIHEQVVPPPDLALPHIPCGVVLHHHGYEAELGREKAARYVPLIEAQAAENPDEAFHPYNLALAHMALGNHAIAAHALRRALDIAFATLAPHEQPTYLVNARGVLAVALLEQGRLTEAAAVCRAALAIAPEFADAWCTLGAAELRRDQPDEAFNAYARAAGCRPSPYQAMHDLGASGWKADLGMGEACLALARWPEAVEHLERAAARGPATSPELERALRAGLGQAPRVAGLHRLQARIHARRGALDTALEEIQRALTIDDGDPQSLELAAELLADAGAANESQAAAQAANAVRSARTTRSPRRPRILFVTCFDPQTLAPMGYIQRLSLLLEGMREIGDVDLFRPTPEVPGISAPSPAAVAQAMEAACEAAAAHGDLRRRRSRSLNATAFAARRPESYDIVFLHRLSTAWWTGWSDPRRTIVDVDDLPSRTYQQAAAFGTALARARARVRHARIHRCERRLGDAFRAVLVASNEDRRYLAHPRATVVPNAYRPHPLMREPITPGDGRTMLFVGTLTFAPNIQAVAWFAREVLPRVRRQIPEAGFTVIGFTPARRTGDWSWVRAPGVRFLGGVRNAGPHVHAASLSVCPLGFGRGTRIKIVESLAFGTPVVSTTIGAFGLPFQEGDGVVRRNDAEAFAAACIELLRDPSRRAVLGETGRTAAFERGSPEAAKGALRDLANTILEESGFVEPRPETSQTSRSSTK